MSEMILAQHDFEGWANGVAIAQASGSGSGDQFTAVTKSGSATLTASTDYAAHGTMSAKTTRTTTSDASSLRWTLGTAHTRLQARVYVRMDAVPSATFEMVRFHAASTTCAYVSLASDGKAQLYNTTNTAIAASKAAATFPVGQWVRLEAAAEPGASTTTGKIEFAYYLGDSLTAVHTYSTSAANTGVSAMDQVRFLVGSGSTNPTVVYLDDLAIGNGAGFIGPTAAVPPTVSIDWIIPGLLDARGSSAPSGDLAFEIDQTAGTVTAPIEIVSGVWAIQPHPTETLSYDLTVSSSAGGSATESVDVAPQAVGSGSRVRERILAGGVWT